VVYTGSGKPNTLGYHDSNLPNPEPHLKNSKDILIEQCLANRDALLRFLSARLRDADAAEDVLQEVYIRISNANLPHTIENPVGFLYRMASNLSLDHIRKHKQQRIRDKTWSEVNTEHDGNGGFAHFPDADNVLMAKERLAVVTKALQTLSPKAREAFVKHKLNGEPYKKVAKDMNVSIGTVAKHMMKAIKHVMEFDEAYRNDN